MGHQELPNKILLIDADRSVANSLRKSLETRQIRMDSASDLSTAQYQFSQNIYPVVLFELDFAELPALVLIQRWRSVQNLDKKNTGIILLLGNRRQLEATEKRSIDELEDIEMITKPIVTAQLISLMQKSQMKREQRLRYDEILNQTRKLASSKATEGEAKAFVQSNLKKVGLKGSDLLREFYEQTQDYSQAVAAMDSMIAQNPKNLSAIHHKGRLLSKQGKFHEALKIFEEIDKVAPQNLDRLGQMTSCYLSVKNPDSAVEKMRQIIKLNSDQQDLKFDMFSMLAESGFDDHAINLCKEISDPREVVRHYNNSGVGLAKAGQVDLAIKEYSLALKYFPQSRENYRILYNLALSHISFKQKDHYLIAREFLEKSLESKSDFDKALHTLQAVDAQLEKWKKSAS